MNSCILTKRPDGTASVSLMSPSQIAEHILVHLPNREACKQFNRGQAVTIDGYTYKELKQGEQA